MQRILRSPDHLWRGHSPHFPAKCCQQTAPSPSPCISTTCASASETFAPHWSLNDHDNPLACTNVWPHQRICIPRRELCRLQEQLDQRRRYRSHQRRHRSDRRRCRPGQRQPGPRLEHRPSLQHPGSKRQFLLHPAAAGRDLPGSATGARPHRPGLQRSGSSRSGHRPGCHRTIRRPGSPPAASVRPATRSRTELHVDARLLGLGSWWLLLGSRSMVPAALLRRSLDASLLGLLRRPLRLPPRLLGTPHRLLRWCRLRLRLHRHRLLRWLLEPQ